MTITWDDVTKAMNTKATEEARRQAQEFLRSRRDPRLLGNPRAEVQNRKLAVEAERGVAAITLIDLRSDGRPGETIEDFAARKLREQGKVVVSYSYDASKAEVEVEYRDPHPTWTANTEATSGPMSRDDVDDLFDRPMGDGRRLDPVTAKQRQIGVTHEPRDPAEVVCDPGDVWRMARAKRHRQVEAGPSAVEAAPGVTDRRARVCDGDLSDLLCEDVG